MRIRRATEADIPALIAMQREGWLHDYRAVIPPGYGERMLARYGDPATLRDHLARYDHYDVAVDDGLVVGAICGELLGPDEAEIWWVHVAREARGLGHGARLIAHFDRQLPPEVAALYVTTFQEYPATIGFYERAGFVARQAFETDAAGITVRELRLRRDRPALEPGGGSAAATTITR
jgi:ribosomal protein S18 acetylase RimI-like enzyme